MHKKKILFSALFFPAVIWAQNSAQITGKVVNSDKTGTIPESDSE